MRSCIAIAILAVGCGRIDFDLHPRDGSTPTSRLRAERWTAPDGANVLARWYDTELGVECSWATTADGIARCMPYGLGMDALNFTDASCTVRALRVARPCADPSIVTLSIPNGPTSYAEAHAIGVAVPVVYGGVPCAVVDDPGVAYYELGAQIPDATFVGRHQVLTPLADGISSVTNVADDGTSEPGRSAVTTATGDECMFETTDPLHAVCAPISHATVGEYARTYFDPQCTIEVTDVIPSGPVFKMSLDNEPCYEPRSVLPGPTHLASTLYNVTATGCTPYPIAPSTVVEVTRLETTLPVLSYAIDGGSTRLRQAGWATSAGERIETGLFDISIGAACSPIQDVSTGATVCAPFGNGADASLYPSSDCSGALTPIHAICDGARVSATAPVGGCEGLAYDLTAYGAEVATSVASHFIPLGGCVAIDLRATRLYAPTPSHADVTQLVPLDLVRD